MANEKTGKKAASVASKVLRDKKSSSAAKTAAGSALTQHQTKSARSSSGSSILTTAFRGMVISPHRCGSASSVV